MSLDRKPVPRFKIPDHPQLEAALNELAASVEGCRNPEFRPGRGMAVTSSADVVLFEALPPDVSVRKTGRFILSFDYDRQRLYVSEGAVVWPDPRKAPQAVEPEIPLLSSYPVGDPSAYFDASTLDLDVDLHAVVVLVEGACVVEFLTDADVAAREDELFEFATFRLTEGAEGGTILESLEQLWASDITRDLPVLSPFWPILNTVDAEALTFTITDGFVVNFNGGNGNTDALTLAYPTGLGTFNGARTVVSIAEGEQITIKVVVDKNGAVTAVTLEVEAENEGSTNPDPTASAGTGLAGEYHFKIAVVRAAVGDVPAYLDPYLAGSHLLLRHRGHNLNHKIHVCSVDSVTGAITEDSYHYQCWRNGDYVGKFLSTDTLPGYVGALDTDDSTYLASYGH